MQTAVTMRQVTGSMAGVVRGMEGAMKAMDLEKVRLCLCQCVCEKEREREGTDSYHIHFRSQKKPFFFPSPPPSLGFDSSSHTTPTQISAVMDKFETQFEDLDVATGYYETATSSATAVGTPQDDVDKLMHMVADAAGVELGAEMKAPETGVPVVKEGAEDQREEGLGERLRALRN